MRTFSWLGGAVMIGGLLAGCTANVIGGAGASGGAGGGGGSPVVTTTGPGGAPGVTASSSAASSSSSTSSSSGTPISGVLVQEGGQPWDITLDATSVYWMNTDGTVKKIPKQGGSIKYLTSGIYNTALLRYDGGTVFLSSFDDQLAVQGMTTAGNNLTVFGQGIGNGALGVDSNAVYWVKFPGSEFWGSGDIMSTARVGGAVKVLVAGQYNPRWLVSDGGYLYWTQFVDESDTPPDPTPGALRRVPLAGGPVEVLLEHLDLSTFVIDGDTIYLTVPGTSFGDHDGSILALPKNGGTPITLAQGITPGYLAIDATDIYFTSSVDHAVFRLSKAGGTVNTLITTGGNPTSIAIDDAAIYWVDPGLGTVNSLAK